MASPKGSSDILAALKREGCVIQEYGDWRNHNRNHVGAWGPVYGVMIHHTVTSTDDGSVALCYNGHSALPGPLCHAVGRNDGKIALVGHGRANHAGFGDDDVLAAVIAERDLPADNEANTDGNRHFHGLEIVNQGNGTDTYPWVQYVGAVKWATAHCRLYGWSEKSVIGHKEWQPGKIDPYGPVIGPSGTRFDFTMNRFRADVKAALALPAGAWGTEEEDMALSADDIQKVAKAVWDMQFESPVDPDGPDREANAFLRWADVRHVQNKERFDAVTAKVDAVQAKVDSISVGGVDLDALAEKVADKLAERLSE